MKKLIAEFIGTATLVFFGCGSAVLAGGEVGQLGISFAFGLAIVAMAYGIGPISGCHVNPAVSFGAFLAAGFELRLQGASYEDIARVQALGAAAVQLGTPFAVTEECDAHEAFKRVLAEAQDEDMVEFTSVAGLPARAVGTPWLRNYLRIEDRLQAVAHAKSRCTKAFDCLAQCGLRDGLAGWGQFCIDNQLAAALRGDVKKGLFFRGVGALPFGAQIRSVRDLMERLLTPMAPAAGAAVSAA